MGLALVLALALGAADPCVATDELGRSFRTCFDAGRGLELSAGGALGDGVAEDAPLAAGLVFRWRTDTRTPSGRMEWLRDMAFVETRARFQGSLGDPRGAETVLWSGLFLRKLAEPFLLIPTGTKPIRFPFPFDVGMAISGGGVRWRPGEGTEADTVDVEAVRGALLLDVARHLGGAFRRASFGPEVSWSLRLEKGAKPVQALAPFSAGRIELRSESADGLTSLDLSARAGILIRFPGETESFWEGRLAAERVLVAINDVPLALYGEALARGGALERELAATVGLRVGAFR
jgi:hypothetical protein